MPDAFVFEWAVDQDGYDVGDAIAPPELGGLHFENATITRRGGPLRYYRPLAEYPDLWRRCADFCHTAADAGAFVTQYGPVWSGFLPEDRFREEPGPSRVFGQVVMSFYSRWLNSGLDLTDGPPVEYAGPILALANHLRQVAAALYGKGSPGDADQSHRRQRAAFHINYRAP
jgi:hypothetical protein